MTKKTNALLFRFGLTTLWKNKCVGNTKIANKIRIENIISKELYHNRLNILVVIYRLGVVIIFVFNRYETLSNFKRLVVSYYNKSLSLVRTIEKFNLSEQIIVNIIKSSEKIILVNTALFVKNTKLIKLFFQKYTILRFMFILCKWLSFIQLDNFLVIYKSLSYWYTGFKSSFKKPTSNKNYLKKIRKIGGLVSIKLISLQLENVIFKVCNYFVDFTINHIFLSKGIFIGGLKIFSNSFKRQDFRLIFSLLFLSTMYNKSNLLSDYIATLIQSSKKHFRVLNIFVSSLEFLFGWNLIQLLGLQLRLNGKLGGKLRKSKYHYKLGKVQLQRLKIGLNYSTSISYTKFGCISVKIWLLNVDSYI